VPQPLDRLTAQEYASWFKALADAAPAPDVRKRTAVYQQRPHTGDVRPWDLELHGWTPSGSTSSLSSTGGGGSAEYFMVII
jgi:hypothetical protein